MSVRDTLYRKALGMLKIDYNKIKAANTDSDTTPEEIAYCDDNIETACNVAVVGRDFFWLVSSVIFTDRLFDWRDKKTNEIVTVTSETTDSEKEKLYKDYYKYHGYDFGYACPSDMYRPYLVDGGHNASFARKGSEIYFPNDGVRMDYIVDISKKLDETSWSYPQPFIDMVACLLAINIAPMVAPEGTFGQNAVTKMQTALSACQDLQKEAFRKAVQSPKEYLE